MVAQLIWYFNEGYANRKGDFPVGSKKTYTKFRVFLEELNEEIVFYKSNKSGRWWIEVPYPGSKNSKFMRQDRKSTRLNSSHVRISYAVFCLKKKKKKKKHKTKIK